MCRRVGSESDVVVVWCVTEIEALEACRWLRAAGFPQYAQMFEGKTAHASLRHSVMLYVLTCTNINFPIILTLFA